MTKTLEIRVRPARADEVALAIRASEPNARVVTSDGEVHNPVEQEFIITRVNTFEVQNEVYFANSPEEARVLLAKLSHVPDGRDWRVFSRPKNGVVNAPPAGECSTRVYQDGTVATGPGNLPSFSPSEQACAI